VHDLLTASGLAGCDLVGSSLGGAFVAEMAALWPVLVRRIVLIAPWGLFDAAEPGADPWAQRPDDVAALMCADPVHWQRLKEPPEGANSPDWPIEQVRANEAAARAFWPLGNTRLERRLGRIAAPTLVLWGAHDRVLPPSYGNRFAACIPNCALQLIASAGHLAELDRPRDVASAVLNWTAH
jgi:pimeloyl-ACP methyl ester carboxylesterase